MPVQSARLSRLLGAPPHLATFEQVTGLVSQRAREDTDLDFKATNSYLTGGDGADELAKDVTAMANARGGLIVIGIEEDDQACARALAPVAVSAKITEQMEQVLRSRVVPWLSGTEVRPVECPEATRTGLYLVSVPRSPLAPHAVRSTGLSRPRYSYAHRAGITTRWLEETEIASAYRDRFALAQDHAAQAREFFADASVPPMNKVSATDTWLELALIPSVGARHHLGTGFVSEVERFLAGFAATAPVPGLARGRFPSVARRLVHFDGGTCLLDFTTDGSAFIRAHAAWRPDPDRQPVPVLWSAFLEYQVLGAVHLAAAYAIWAGAYGDADILAATRGTPEVLLETGRVGMPGDSPARRATRRTDCPTHVTVPLDAICDDPRELHLAARSIASDLLADYGHPDTRLLSPDGTIAYQLLEHGYQGPLRRWIDDNLHG
jgi:hypothetical protein